MEITFRVYGPEIRKAVVDWTRKHLVGASGLRASVDAYRPGAPYGNAWALDGETHINVTFDSEHNPGASVNVHIDGPDVCLAVVEWSQAHLLMARNLAAEPVLRRRVSAHMPWSLVDEEDYVYINLAFESEKP